MPCVKRTLGKGDQDKIMMSTQIVVWLLVLPANSEKAAVSLRSVVVLE